MALEDEVSKAEDLLSRIRRRDKSALKDLSEKFGKGLARAAFLFLGDAHLAEDAVQDALIGAWEGAARTGPDTPLRPWIFGILFNQCRKRARAIGRSRRREIRFASGHREASENQGGSGAGPGPEHGPKLRLALDGLDEIHRMVVVLRYERGLSVTETARALSIPEGTVKSRTHAAAEILKAAIKENTDE